MADFEKSDIGSARCVYLDHQGRLEFELANGKVAIVECEVSERDTVAQEDLEPPGSIDQEPSPEEPQPETEEPRTVEGTDQQPPVPVGDGAQGGEAQGAPAGVQEQGPGFVATETTE